MPKFVFLWTDLFLWALTLAVLLYGVYVSRHEALRNAWFSILRTPSAAGAGVLMLVFFLVGLLDSIHYRPVLPAAQHHGSQQSVHYAPFVRSLLDEILHVVHLDSKERSYSAPFARTLFFKETQLINGEPVRDFPPLENAARDIEDDAAHIQHIRHLLFKVFGWGVVYFIGLRLLLFGLTQFLLNLAKRKKKRQRRQSSNNTDSYSTHSSQQQGKIPSKTFSFFFPLPPAMRAVWVSLGLLGLVAIAIGLLSPHFYLLGTDRAGNDVIYQAMKSIRTAWVIGTLTTVAMLPPALFFGIAAGYFKGWVDDLIQYLYTTLTSIPGVLLIAACVLMMQVYIDTHPDFFDTVAMRADVRLFLLCLILGLTGWAGLCRLLRAETLKLRELEYIQAARAFGLGHLKIMWRHILPNVMHIVLITMVLEFSGLVLYEAVLSYLGIGVDPSMPSFGTMIDAARLEMSRDPMIWWNLLAAFVFLLALVLAANIFADAVQRAFDPRQRQLAPQAA